MQLIPFRNAMRKVTTLASGRHYLRTGSPRSMDGRPIYPKNGD